TPTPKTTVSQHTPSTTTATAQTSASVPAPSPGELVQAPSNLTQICDHDIQPSIEALVCAVAVVVLGVCWETVVFGVGVVFGA
ncbi:hypothetical protein, partial [Mycolicibacterium insubricum]|uniref:hypothetical protein n=1 Tax=Mycolicibacterium insubricum TaxID=444597 RepID=UPI001A98FE27